MATDYTPGYNPSRRDMEQRQSWTREVPGFSQLMMGMTQQAREHVAETRPFQGTPTLETGLETVVKQSPEKKAAVADYVNQQQAGLVASGLEEARANRATQGRGVRMVKGYLQNIQSDPRTLGLNPAVQQALANRQYLTGKHPTSYSDGPEGAKTGTGGNWEAVADEIRGESVGEVAGGSIRGHHVAPWVNATSVRASKTTGPRSGVGSVTFSGDVAGKGGITPRLLGETTVIKTEQDADAMAARPRSRSRLLPSQIAGERPATQGDDRKVQTATTGFGARTLEERAETQAEVLSDAMKGHVQVIGDFMDSHTKENPGTLPSIRIIATGTGLSAATVNRALNTAAMQSRKATMRKTSAVNKRSASVDEIMANKPSDLYDDIDVDEKDIY